MSEQRIALVSTLRHIVAGGDLKNDELWAIVADPVKLTGTERKAWHGLSYWADDDDIRAKDPEYAGHRRAQLAELLDDLVRDDSK